MGDQITVLEGLLVTVVSMIVVFGVLILISYLIGALKTISEDKNELKEEVVQTVSTEGVEKEISQSTMEDKDGLNEEVVAVIAAAVAVNLDLNIPDIRIKGIRRIPQNK